MANQLMLDLLAYLRQEVAGPALLVHRQLFTLCFTHPDLGGPICIEPQYGRYQISRAVPLSWFAWHYTSMISFATSAAEASQKLFRAFAHQPTPQEWKQDLLNDPWDISSPDPRELRTFAMALRLRDDEHQDSIEGLYRSCFPSSLPRLQHRVASLLHLINLIQDQTSQNMLWAHPVPGMGVLLSQSPTDTIGVTVQAGRQDDFLVFYPFRSARASWPDALLEQHAQNAAEAVHLIALGMEHIARSAAEETDGV